jgi:hypothetical protein
VPKKYRAQWLIRVFKLIKIILTFFKIRGLAFFFYSFVVYSLFLLIPKFILHNLTVPFPAQPAAGNSSQQQQIGFVDLCMSYAWKCYENDHITMLRPKGHWTGGLKAEIVDFAKDIIEQEVPLPINTFGEFYWLTFADFVPLGL